MYNKLCILNTKTLQFLVYKKSFFFEKLTFRSSFESYCSRWRGKTKTNWRDFFMRTRGRRDFYLFW